MMMIRPISSLPHNPNFCKGYEFVPKPVAIPVSDGLIPAKHLGWKDCMSGARAIGQTVAWVFLKHYREYTVSR